eukprot:scaffold23265_cov59-Phaeocystis_antarctica.AAC.5
MTHGAPKRRLLTRPGCSPGKRTSPGYAGERSVQSTSDTRALGAAISANPPFPGCSSSRMVGPSRLVMSRRSAISPPSRSTKMAGLGRRREGGEGREHSSPSSS